MKKKIYYFVLPVIALAIFISGCASNVEFSINNGVEKIEAAGNYEYKVVDLHEIAAIGGGENSLENILNEHAKDGWEFY